MKIDTFSGLHNFKIISFLFILFTLLSCTTDNIKRNPFLYEISFNHSINLNLPQYDNLNFAGGSMFVDYGGINGLLIFNLNGNDIFAWEASCSNHSLETCSKLEIEGLLANCGCDGFKYSLATGQLLEGDITSSSQYPLLNYKAQKSGKIIIISN